MISRVLGNPGPPTRWVPGPGQSKSLITGPGTRSRILRPGHNSEPEAIMYAALLVFVDPLVRFCISFIS